MVHSFMLAATVNLVVHVEDFFFNVSYLHALMVNTINSSKNGDL
jgi:hypothetical protein